MADACFRPVESPEDFDAYAALRNHDEPDHPTSGALILEGSQIRDQSLTLTRDLWVEDGRILGRYLFAEERGEQERVAWWEFGFWDSAHYSQYGNLFVERAIRQAEALNIEKLMTVIESSEVNKPPVLERHGFELVQKNPLTCLRLAGFEFTRYQPQIETLAGQGISFERIDDAIHGGNLGVIRDFYNLDNQLSQDIPSPCEFVPPPFEEYLQKLQSERGKAFCCFVAKQGGEMIGMTEVMINPIDPRIGWTGLTGVRREFRRRGIARALKAVCLAHVQLRGVERVFTDNEESNPMLKLNFELGFEHVRDVLQYQKRLSGSSRVE